ncbi:hypothetical protein [Tropicibacter naphthalenivorans]|uniref:Uncharacterized protein n=1 Tax=Tropicibacter naphthalenivorans TaxID=441103 RepID=A0A0N7LZ92_9RHOB|nr:hypothetical protein [Tropicibacter naphthalenivorans]CUH77017.1 hypothetical protein TRN7648_01249 [Tropicibacter naphthalenivorans]SMC61525.1 hypothetical protein SAMN04488093_102369 [Tropicibacter naphthalenivorans]
MILTLIIGVVAGYAARPAEPKMTEALVSLLGADNLPDVQDRRAASLLLCLLLGAALCALLGLWARVFVFVFGAALGYFQANIREAILNRRD